MKISLKKKIKGYPLFGWEQRWTGGTHEHNWDDKQKVYWLIIPFTIIRILP